MRTLGDEWGALVKSRRELLGFSQADLAEKCAVTQQTISKIENGLMIPLDRLKATLADALRTTPAELFPWPKVKAS